MKLFRPAGLRAAFYLAAVSSATAAALPPPELPVETFFKKPNIAALTFSPDGKRIACLIPFERRMNLAVIDLEKKTKNLLTNFKDNDVGSFLWASDDRLVQTTISVSGGYWITSAELAARLQQAETELQRLLKKLRT